MAYDAIEMKNAKIKSTSFGFIANGIESAYLHLDYGGAGQGFGGYRLGGAWGMEFLLSVLRVLKVNEWEKLPGTPCRVLADHGKVHAIGHYLEDKWFNPEEDLAHLKE